MDIETGSVDNLLEKPRIDVNRGLGKTIRGGTNGYKCLTPGFNPVVGKVVHGTSISKNKAKSMSNSILEDFSPDVLYSLKKKKRWEELSSVDSVLNIVKEDSPSFTVSAIETNFKGYLPYYFIKQQGIQAYGRIKSDSDEIEKISTRSKTGGPYLSLEDTLEPKDRKKDKKKKKFKKQDVRTREPEVTVIIEKQIDTHKLSSMSFDQYERPYKGVMKTQRSNKFFYDMFNEQEDIFNESDEEIFNEVEDKEISDDFDGEIIDDFDKDILDEVDDEMIEKTKNFQLSDFIKPPSEKKERVHQKKIKEIEFVDEIPFEFLESPNHQKALDEHAILKNSSFFSKKFDLCAFFLKPEDFVPKLEEWVEGKTNTLKIIWLDEDKTKCLLDMSKLLGSRTLVAVVGFTLLGKKKKYLKVTFNTSFPLEFPESNFKKFHKSEKMISSFFDIVFGYLKEAFKKLFLEEKNLKFLKDAFQIKSDATIESFNDYNLLEKFSKPTEDNISISTSVSSLHSVHYDYCEFCDQQNPSDLLNLSCIHSLCLSCARFVFKHQIINHTKELICPICESTQDLMKLTLAVPLPLIKTFLKEKFKKISKNKVQECPRCSAYFEKIPGINSVSCKYCCISFCQDCLQPPHFPISCDQMKIWSPKFEKQYKVCCLNEIPKYGQCTCGSYIELSTPSEQNYFRVTCRECNKTYGKNTLNEWVHYHYSGFTYLRILDASAIPTYIKKPFAELSTEARKEIKNEAKTTEIRKLGREFLDEDKLGNFIELRLKVLKLIEFGTAWLYFERKNQGSHKNKEISKTLRRLKILLDIIVYQILNKSDSKIQENLISLQDSYSKSLAMF